MVIGEGEKCIQGKVAALRECVEAAVVPAEAQAEAAREARAAVDAAVAAEALTADKLCGVQAESAEAAARADAAKVAVAECSAKLAPALDMQGARQGELDHFRSYSVFLFELIRHRKTKKDVGEQLVGGAAGVLLSASLAGA